MGNDGLFISDTEPTDREGKFTWLQILPDGTRKWYEKTSGDAWQLTKTENAPAFVDEEGVVTPDNIQIKNLNITGNLFYNGDNGANADITVGGLHMVVKEGIVTTLEEV